MLRLSKLLLPSFLVLLLAPSLATAQERVYQAQPNPAEAKRPARGAPVAADDDDAWGRQQWFLERMGGPLTAEFYQRLVHEAEQERARYPALFPRQGLQNHSAVVSGTWTALGPTGASFEQNGVTLTKVDSGRARTILPDTANPDVVYYLTAGGGLWKTANFTATPPTWTATTDAIGTTAGGSAAFGRTTTGASTVIYLGAGDPFDGGVGGLVFKSVNGAGAWGTGVALKTATTAATRVLDIKVDTSVGTTTATDIVLVGTDDGVYRSADGGATFTAVGTATFSKQQAWSLSRTSAGWLVTIEDPDSKSATYGVGSLYLSIDKGLTWTKVTSTVLAGFGRATLAVGLPGDAAVYCFAASTGDSAQLDLFKSVDGGKTWAAVGLASKTPTPLPTGDQTTMDLMSTQAFYNHMILVDPNNAGAVYLGGKLAAAKSTNGGQSWAIISDWLAQGGLPYIHADFHAAAVVKIGTATRLFIGTDGGIFTSTDGGATWDDKKNNGLATHLVYALAVQPSIPGSALIGLQDNGTRIRQPAPSMLYDQVRGGDGFGVGWAGSSGVALSSYVYNQLRRATTSPVTDQSQWKSFVSGLPAQDTNNFYFVTPVITPTAGADPTGQVFFTNGRLGLIFRSNATGWTQIASAGTGGLGATRTIRAVSHGLGIHPSDLNRIAGAANGGYLIITTDGGKTWTERFLGISTSPVVPGWEGFNSNVAWASDQVLYVSSEASTPALAAHVAKSTDGGATWSRMDSGLPDVPVSKLVVDLGDGSGNTVYAATWLGVYRTTDGAATWTRFGAGLPQARVSDIYLAPDDSFIRVATWGRGVWDMQSAPVTGSVSIAPPSVLLYPGDSITFSGQVTGGGSVTYSASAGTITAAGLYTAPSSPGNYTVTATGPASGGSKTATANVLVSTPTPVSITSQPANAIAAVGFTATFTVAATGSGTVASGYNLTYQWKKNGAAIAGATAAAYTTPALDLPDNAAQFTCDVTGRAGTVGSAAATLVVQPVGAATSASSTTVTFLPDNPAPAVEVPFTISGVAGKVGEVTVSMWITHTFIGDQLISLVAPDGTAVVISNNVGNTGSTGSPTGAAYGTACGTYLVLSDRGAASINTQSSPPAIVGTFRPSFPLTVLTGKAPNGTWKLRFLDGGPSDTGSFKCGVVSVKPLVASLDLNVDASVDVYDVLELLKRYGSTAAPDLAKADLTGDGLVNDADLTLLQGGL